MTNTKACSRCKQIKPRAEFGRHTQTKDGLYSQCLVCRRQARTEYRKRHVEKIKQEQRANYLANREERIAYAKKQVENNRERYRQYSKNYKKRNLATVAANTRRRNARRKANGIYKITKKELTRLLSQPCFYCGENERITIDHVVAIARGGTDSIGNLVAACKSCNSRKRELTIMEWRKKRLGR